jgi:hypothetical protein
MSETPIAARIRAVAAGIAPAVNDGARVTPAEARQLYYGLLDIAQACEAMERRARRLAIQTMVSRRAIPLREGER